MIKRDYSVYSSLLQFWTTLLSFAEWGKVWTIRPCVKIVPARGAVCLPHDESTTSPITPLPETLSKAKGRTLAEL